MLVKAIKPGFYANVYRNVGDKFQVEKKQFSKIWMKNLEVGKPAKEEKAEIPKSEKKEELKPSIPEKAEKADNKKSDKK